MCPEIFIKLSTEVPHRTGFSAKVGVGKQAVIEITFCDLPKSCTNFKTAFPFSEITNIVSTVINI